MILRGISPKLVRMAFVVGAAFSTLGLLAYVVLFVWMPKAPEG
ncbi:MAG: PspC domain-containing protein [SAR202 cluster bacterium]|nr:PspC domain-containing protein [SAR202 cluster bacterium]